jgi:hypothetical protein
MFAILVPKSVSTMTLTTANNAHKHVTTVLRNAEEWLDKLTTHIF